MTTDELLARLAGRGIAVVGGPDGDLCLRGPKGSVTPALLKAIRWHKAAIADRVGRPPPFDHAGFRDRLEKFWDETGWTPVGGWKQGERSRHAQP